jgi:transcriptional regulator with XRE-family HTH domain
VAGTTSRRKPPHAPNPVHRPAYVAFLKTLQQIRQDSGLTIRELAERMGRPRTWVHKCDTGQRRMDVPEFLEWCQACGIDYVTAAKMLKRR